MKIDAIALSQSVELFTHGYPYLGPACWILTIQYFVAQIVAAIATTSAYHWGTDAISYLGITECTVFNKDYVCSPLHALFNLSLIGLGVMMAAGAFLLYHQFNKSPGTLAGFSTLALAAFGTVLVGVFPANTHDTVHSIGTGLAFVGSVAGVFMLSFSLRELPRPLRCVMVCSGTISLIGIILLALVFFWDIGYKGAAERITSYPTVLWLIVFGVYISVGHFSGRTPWLPVHAQRRR